jgi:tRNA(Ile)-lysidine synthase
MSLTEKNLTDSIYSYIIENELKQGSTILVGLSGGPDSTALLLLLSRISHRVDMTIKAAYVNHGMRNHKQLEADDIFVHDLTENLGIELFSRTIPQGEIEHICRHTGRSSEDVAREYRYAFFNKISHFYKNCYIALGHNQDDQFETMISRFFQGAGISGLRGIPSTNNLIIRPLIKTSKQEILSYLAGKKQTYRQDPTNLENNYLRNQIRNELLPLIERIFPGYGTSLNSLQKKFSEIEIYFQSEADKINCEYGENYCSVSLSCINSSHKLIRKNIFYKMFDQTYKGKVQALRVPEGFFNSLLDSVLTDDRVYATAYGIKIYTSSGKLYFKSISYEESGFYFLINPNETCIPGMYRISRKKESSLKLEVVEGSPLIFRSRSEGDFIIVNDRRKTLKSLFSRWKVPEDCVNLIPVLEDSSGIIAVLGEYQGFENIIRNKKINNSEKFNILYLEVENIFHE